MKCPHCQRQVYLTEQSPSKPTTEKKSVIQPQDLRDFSTQFLAKYAGKTVTTEEIYKEYVEYCIQGLGVITYNHMGLIHRLRKLGLPQCLIKRIKGKATRIYKIPEST